MKGRKLTGIFILVLIVAIAVYDIYIINVAGKDASISQVLIDYAYDYPSFPFIFGFICGHLFWRMGGDRRKKHE